ncbi:MAG: prohibitin family protein [Saprospiraceae bacterium]|nr:prohibitin family protein [Saprospiraceae bacterium]
MAQQPPPDLNVKKVGFIVVIVIAVILVIAFGNRMFYTIDAGHGGVLFKTFSGGVDTKTTYGEGFHIIAPWNKLNIYSLLQQEKAEEMRVLSSNGLEIAVDVSCWYLPKASELGFLHQTVGVGYAETVIIPSLRSAARSVIGRYTPEEIYSSKRDAIQDEIYDETKNILETKHIQLNKVLIRSIILPPTIKSAIESKLKQEQLSLEYEFKLAKALKEAERQKIEAVGKAAANKIISESLTDKILQEKGIDATLELSKSPNTKVIVIGGGKDGLPLILGNN